MIYKNVELFNVEEVRKSEDGLKIYRFPKNVISEMKAKDSALTSTGCEIRFVGEAYITIGVANAFVNGYGRVEVYRGDILYTSYVIPSGQKIMIKLLYNTIADNCAAGISKVWRIVFGNDFAGIVYDIEPFGEIRPPANMEMPQKTILAYGSSITHGACAVVHSNSHIFKLAQKLGVDIEDKGVGGGCFCEKEVCDYLTQKKCDLLYLELGTNMMDTMDVSEYYKKAAYMFSSIDTSIPTVFISPYTYFASVSPNEEKRKLVTEYQKASLQLFNDFRRENMYFINGLDIVDDINMLTCDMIHPSIYGHHIMSQRLYEQLKNIAF